MTDPAPVATPESTSTAPPRRTVAPKKGHAAPGARLLVGGLAAGAGLAMVGAMAAAAQATEPIAAPVVTTTIQRIVVVETPAPSDVVVMMESAPVAAQPEVVTRIVTREIPAPAPARPAPQPQTQSGGS